MSKYFKTGLALLIPVLLVLQVTVWVFNWTKSVIELFIPDIQWWYVPISLLLIFGLVVLLGAIFANIKIFAWAKEKVEDYIIDYIPIINKVYDFGREISSSFASDYEEDKLKVVEVKLGGIKMMGVLTDPTRNTVFIVSAPSPLTGWVIRTKNYRILNMNFADLTQINTSLGRINGHRWEEK